MKSFSVRSLCEAAAIAALYAVLSFFSSAFGIGYGPIQCRLSEALCLLPMLTPSAVWGVTVGCLISNILSPYGILDLIVGTASTFLAALLTRRARNSFSAALPPVFCNGILIGALIAFEEAPAANFVPAFLYNACTVAGGEALACFLIGLPLVNYLKKNNRLGW